MLVEIVIAIFLGMVAGTFTGLTPGIHINLVAVLVLTSSPFLLEFTSPLILAIFIVSMSITHTFCDFIPSCYLGAPESETALAVLPAHRLLLRGKAYEAVFLTTMGSLFSVFLIVLLFPFILLFISFSYPHIKPFIGYILILLSFFLIMREKSSKFLAFIIFSLSGILGLALLDLGVKESLFPLFSGLFGLPNLLVSIKDKINIPKQIVSNVKIKSKTVVKSLSSSFVVGTIFSFLPGLGPGQAAIMCTQFFKKMSTKGFLIIVGALGTINMLISFLALYAIDKARNGSVVIISEIVKTITYEHIILIMGISLVVGSLATILTLKISKVFSEYITKINYQFLCIFIIAFVTLLVLIISSWLGLLVLITSTFIGLIPVLRGVGRNHLMGSLLLPTIIFFLF